MNVLNEEQKKQIQELKEETGCGILDAKRALTLKGNFEDAKKYLQSSYREFGKLITRR